MFYFIKSERITKLKTLTKWHVSSRYGSHLVGVLQQNWAFMRGLWTSQEAYVHMWRKTFTSNTKMDTKLRDPKTEGL